MEWKCPDCNAENPKDVTRCPCGYEIGRQHQSLKKRERLQCNETICLSSKYKTILVGTSLTLLIVVLFFMFAPSDRINSINEAWLRINNNPGQKCLDLARKNIADPDSARIISFSFDQEESVHVLTFRAKNSYGAYEQGKFFCDSSGGEDTTGAKRLLKRIQEENKRLEKLQNRTP